MNIIKNMKNEVLEPSKWKGFTQSFFI